MEKAVYFISDAHLGIDPPGCKPDRERRLIELLRSWKSKASHIVIVGDLFEFWYEYRYYVACDYISLIRVFAELVEAGVQVHLIRGNHDFALGTFFEKCLGVQVHDNYMFETQGKKVYVAHGDGVIKSDWRYRLYRKILDCSFNQWLFRQIHPDWGMSIARFVGRNSRKYGEDKIIRLDEYLEWGKRIILENKCDFCIHGHHHLSGIWNVDCGVVASPGEWIKKFTFLQLEKGELSLIELE